MSGKLKEVRERIQSVQSTQQITKAMKMVAAAKLRRAQDAILQMRPYSNKLNDILQNILSNMEGSISTSFGVERDVERVLIVVVTSNRGLCGAFNSNIIKAAHRCIQEQYAEQNAAGNVKILCVGKRGYDYFRKRYPAEALIEDHVLLFSDLSFDNVGAAAKELIKGFEDKTYDVIEAVYGRFKNAATQYPEVERFLPVKKLDKPKGKKHRADYIFEPNKNDLLENLIPSILETSFYKFMLDTHASEHGARMTAMDQATENAEEMLRDLNISYNKARQESITKELSEIVGGAAALEG